jgi:hypothetical protein
VGYQEIPDQFNFAETDPDPAKPPLSLTVTRNDDGSYLASWESAGINAQATAVILLLQVAWVLEHQECEFRRGGAEMARRIYRAVSEHDCASNG